MNTYELKIDTLIRDNSNPDRPNMITRVMTSMTGTRPDGRMFYSGVIFDLPPTLDTDNYTLFPDLTEEQVKNWCMGQTEQWQAAKDFIDMHLANEPTPQRNDNIVFPPWVHPAYQQEPVPTQPAGVNPDSIPVVPPDSVYNHVTESQVREVVLRVMRELYPDAGGTA